MSSEKKQKQVLARVKVWLLMGKTITPLQAWQKFGTSRLAVYIHRLRKLPHDMKIAMTMIRTKKGDSFAEYKLDVKPKKKVNHRLV